MAIPPPFWKINFEQNQFSVYPFTPDEQESPDEQNALVRIPSDIYKSNLFFGFQRSPIHPEHRDINFYAWEFARNLSENPYFRRAEWHQWLSDLAQTQDKSGNRRWLYLNKVGEVYPSALVANTQTQFALAYLFWKGLFYYLHSGERWRAENAAVLYLLSAWQSFSMARYLVQVWLAADQFYVGEQAREYSQNALRWLNSELIEITRSLDTLLKDPDFRYPIENLLWLMDPRGGQESNSYQPQAAPEERLFYGMALIPNRLPQDGAGRWEGEDAWTRIAGYLPVFDPNFNQESQDVPSPNEQEQNTDSLEGALWDYGCVIKNPVVIDGFRWEAAQLHPAFTKHEHLGLHSFIRKLISGWLLPRYDFAGAFHLARLLHPSGDGSHERAVRDVLKSAWRWGLLLLAFMVVLGQLPVILGTSIPGAVTFGIEFPEGRIISVDYTRLAADFPLLWNQWFVGFEVLVVIVLAFIYVRTHHQIVHLDPEVLPYLLLPRLMGGIIVGYAAILLQGDSINLKNALFTGGSVLGWILAAGLMFGVWLVGSWYFYHEALARIRSDSIAKSRSKALFWISLMASFLIGLVIVSMTTAMEWQADECKNVILYACQTQGPFLIGPLGIIDLRQMAVFVSLAMLTGFVSQFIFEEKPVTASIWEEK